MQDELQALVWRLHGMASGMFERWSSRGMGLGWKWYGAGVSPGAVERRQVCLATTPIWLPLQLRVAVARAQSQRTADAGGAEQASSSDAARHKQDEALSERSRLRRSPSQHDPR